MSRRYADLNVILVEPSSMQTRSVSNAFTDIGIQYLRTADSGNAALRLMCEMRPDVVVSALYLPDMSGSDLVMAMRQDPDLAGVSFILISSETRRSSLEAARQAGICGILPKPFTSAQLAHVFNTSLDYLALEDNSEHADFETEELRVLVVDDSEHSRRFLRRLLEKIGVRNILEARNGKEALAVLSEAM